MFKDTEENLKLKQDTFISKVDKVQIHNFKLQVVNVFLEPFNKMRNYTLLF